MKLTLLLGTLLSCSVMSMAEERGFIYLPDSTVHLNNNTILLSSRVDTIMAKDPITGKTKMIWDYIGYSSTTHPDKIIVHPMPVLLNGEEIHSMNGAAEIKHCGETKKKDMYLAEHIQRKMKRYYSKLNGAGYNADIKNIVVNKDGRIVYYEYSGLQKVNPAITTVLSQKYIEKVNKKAIHTLNTLTMTPATIKDKPIAYRLKHYELL